MSLRKSKFWLISMLTVLLFVGCATKSAPPSGFLGSAQIYEQMIYNEEFDVLEYIPDPAALKKYELFVVSPVEIQVDDPELHRQLRTSAHVFRRKLIEALGDNYSILDQPSKNVAVLRVAITAGAPNRGLLNLAEGRMPGSAGTTSTSMEAMLIDSVTRRLVAAVKDTRQPPKVGPSRWGHMDSACEFWANNLRRRLRAAGK